MFTRHEVLAAWYAQGKSEREVNISSSCLDINTSKISKFGVILNL